MGGRGCREVRMQLKGVYSFPRQRGDVSHGEWQDRV